MTGSLTFREFHQVRCFKRQKEHPTVRVMSNEKPYPGQSHGGILNNSGRTRVALRSLWGSVPPVD